jgi:ADP-ribosylation factor-like protein 6
VEQFSRDRLQFTVFDMSGQGRYRDIWPHYYSETDAIVFVLDASDKTRLCVVKDELNHLFRHPSISKNRNKRKLPILFFFNKIDVEGSMGLEECKIASGLLEWEQDQKHTENEAKKTLFDWKFQPCQATVGKGLNEGFSWLSDKLYENLK